VFEITRTAEWVAPLDEGATVAMDVQTQAEFEQGIEPDVRSAYEGPCDLVVLAVPAGQGVIVQTAVRRFLNVEQGER